MNPLADRVFRIVLRAYPTDFRRSYGEAMVQSVLDRHRHQGVSWSRLVLGELFDATRVAPQMRWESPMNQLVIVALAASAAALTGIAISPAAVVPLVAAMIVAVVWWSRQNRPIDSSGSTRRWHLWFGAGLATIAAGIAIPAIDGGELNEFWWTIFAAALLAGTAMTLFGIVLAVNGHAQRVHHRAN